jgi:hypothetical protein
MTDYRDEPEELSYEDVEDLIAGARDLMRAADVVAVVERDPALGREAIAGLFAVIRHVAETQRRIALALRRVPAMAERAPGHLEDLARAIDDHVLGVSGEDEQKEEDEG